MPPKKGWVKTEIVCPIHRIALTEKTNIIFKDRPITVAFCPRCKCLYSNNSSVITNRVVTKDGQEVVWSNLHMLHADSQKKRKIKVVTPTFYNRPINVVKKNSRALVGENIIEAIDRVTQNETVVADIRGYLDTSEKKFYATPNVFTLGQITVRPLDALDISDPDNLLSEGKKTKVFLQAWQADVAERKEKERDEEEQRRQREKRRQEVMEAAYPGQLFSVPLLREETDNSCPYCGKELHEKKIIKCVVYRDLVPHHCVFVEVSYCKFCNIPICTQWQLKGIRKKISPDVIKVIYTDTCPTKTYALAVCYEKVKKLEHKQAQTDEKQTMPYVPKVWSKELPNLSELPHSDSVFIYAKKCSCEICHKKYGRDTIVDRKATVLTEDGRTVDVNVQFCMGCGRFFMNLKSYYAYKKLYGDLKVQLRFDDSIQYSDGNWLNFADDSVLSRNGYNVKAGTPRETRQAALCKILDNGLATKHEVISLLTQFIQLHQTTKPGACARWREDIMFVNHYEIENQIDVGVKSLKQGAKIGLNQKEN